MNKKQFFLNGISMFLGLIFFTSGMAKVYFEHKFPGIIGPVWLEKELAEYGLGMFARFIAFSQIIAGFILLTLRYRTLGAIMLLPMVLGILMVTISLNWQGTPYVVSFFLLLNFILLIADAKKLLPLAGFNTASVLAPQSQGWKMLGIWVVGLVLVLASIAVSYLHLRSGQLLCLVGLGVGFTPYFMQGRAGRSINHTSGKKSEKETIPVKQQPV